MDIALKQRLIDLKTRIVEKFEAHNWEDIGFLTGTSEVLEDHPRLFGSLYWQDDDYPGNALEVIEKIVEQYPQALSAIESYVDQHFPSPSTYISAKPSERKITFAPHVFDIPEADVENDLVAIMMPFSAEFDQVYKAIEKACLRWGLRCIRADNIWEDSTIIQDIFNLLFRAQVIIVDFSGKNPNVMYETGIAHTLGKQVVPISQSYDDVPFDIQHHRILKYLPNTEGLKTLEKKLADKLHQLTASSDQSQPSEVDDDDLPF